MWRWRRLESILMTVCCRLQAAGVASSPVKVRNYRATAIILARSKRQIVKREEPCSEAERAVDAQTRKGRRRRRHTLEPRLPAPPAQRRSRERTPVTEASTPTREPNDGEWTVVKRKKKAPRSYAFAAAPAPNNIQSQPQMKKKARKPKLAVLRTPAVPVTLEAYADSKGFTYSHVV
ncbi:unnamed protein product [Euphydryas editha]|uniref:Secreted protein n=1 Tax=Euphydryas editha TaxID=104508 RepID=A0AAU9T7X9_EUPED|nr:unnamed protein product [Euphydryas editha]